MDILTGEVTVLSSSIVYDAGRSLNPMVGRASPSLPPSLPPSLIHISCGCGHIIVYPPTPTFSDTKNDDMNEEASK